MTLVERLRAYAKDQGGWHNIDETCEEAADRIEALEAENKALRQIIHETASALPNGAFIAPSCSVEFMAGLPNEVKSVCSTLEAELEKAREAALEEAAKVAEADVDGCILDIFTVNGQTMRNPKGHDTFMSTVRISDLLRKRAAAIRSLSHKEE